MIKSYIESVIDTEDKDSIPNLMSRKAPIKDWVFYYVNFIPSFYPKFPNQFYIQTNFLFVCV